MRPDTWRWRAQLAPETVADWAEVQELERDVLLLYHQLSEYSNIMGDLYYGDVFALPYWEYLNPTGLDPERGEFIQQGCLVMLLAMAWDRIDGSGDYLDKHREAIHERLRACLPLSAQSERVLAHVRAAVAAPESPAPEPRGLREESGWVHQAVVRGYFAKKAMGA